MKNSKLFYPIFLYVVLMCVLSDNVYAVTDQLDKEITKWESNYFTWKVLFFLALLGTLTVAVLGVFAGTLQNSVKKVWKNTSVYCAFGVTLITAIIAASGIKDHGTIWDYLAEAEDNIRELKNIQEKIKSSTNNRMNKEFLLEEANDYIYKLVKIKKVIIGMSSEIEEFSFVGSAYARSEAPEWFMQHTDNPEIKGGNVLIISTAERASANEAKKGAEEIGLQKLVNHIRNEINILVGKEDISPERRHEAVEYLNSRAETIAKKLLSHSASRDRYFTESGQNKYQYGIRYEIDQEQIFVSLKLSLIVLD